MTSTSCSSTRPGRSPSATVRPASCSRSRGCPRPSWPRPRCSSSLADETPEGRSIVAPGPPRLRHRGRGGRLGRGARGVLGQHPDERPGPPGRRIRKGAGSAVAKWVHSTGAPATSEVTDGARRAGRRGSAAPAVRRSWSPSRSAPDRARLLGVVHLKDIVKDGMRERFDEMRAMGIRTVMITGDNAVTAAAIAARRPGSTTSWPRPRPRTSSTLIRKEQAGRPDGRDVRGRHERRAGAVAGRRRGRDEHRHGRGQGGRQHGRPRLRPDQAHRDRRDRQAAADHPWGADDVLGRQRRREVLRDPPGDVRGRPTPTSTSSTSCGCRRRSRRSSPPSCSTR